MSVVEIYPSGSAVIYSGGTIPAIPIMGLASRWTVQLEADVAVPGQAWFWTAEWQAGEREADAEIAAGRAAYFDSDDEFLAALDREME